MKRLAAASRTPHFWIILFLLVVCILLHYPQQMPFFHVEVSSLLGLERHAVERVLFLLLIVYAGVVFGLRGGIVCLVIAMAAMLPRVFLISLYPIDALFESGGVIVTGSLFNWWLELRRRQTGQAEQALFKLEAVRRELEFYIQGIKENERRLSLLRSVTTVMNQSLTLEETVGTAADKIQEAVGVDCMLFFLVNQRTGELELTVHRGVSPAFAQQVDRLKVGEGFNGLVAQTGEPYFVEDSFIDPRLSREVVKKEGLRSQFIVPLKSKEKVVGTLCAASRSIRQLLKRKRSF